MSSKKVYIHISLINEDDVENYDIKRDRVRKMWYVYEGSEDYELLINKYDVIEIDDEPVNNEVKKVEPYINYYYNYFIIIMCLSFLTYLITGKGLGPYPSLQVLL